MGFDLTTQLGAPTPYLPNGPVGPPPARGTSGDWGSTLKQLMPFIIAGIAGKTGGPVAAGQMLASYRTGIERRHLLERQQAEQDAAHAATEEERQFRRSQADQSQRERAARFQVDALQSIEKFADPAERAHAIELYEGMGQAFGLQPGWLKGAPAPDTSKADVAEASRVLETVHKQYGDQFNTLLETGATVPFRGKPTSLRALQALAGVAVSDVEGKPIKATPAEKPEKYDEAWYIGESIKDAEERKGKPLTRGERLRAADAGRAKHAAAGRAPEKPGGGVDNVGKRQAEMWRENQIAALEQRRRPGKPDLYGKATPGLSDDEYQAELARIDTSYQRMLKAAGVPVETPPAPLQGPPLQRPVRRDPTRLYRDMRLGGGAPPPAAAAEPKPAGRASTPQSLIGRTVTLKDGRRILVERVNAQGLPEGKVVP